MAQARQAGLPDAMTPKLDLVLEEALVNVANHAYGTDTGEVEISCSTGQAGFCCTIRDWGEPFNPLKNVPPEMETTIEERQVGGLGIQFIATIPDTCEYTRNADRNELTFCFAL